MVPFKPATDSTVCCTLRMYGYDCDRRQSLLRPVRSPEAGLLARANTLGIGATSCRGHSLGSLGRDRSASHEAGRRAVARRRAHGPPIFGRPAGPGPLPPRSWQQAKMRKNISVTECFRVFSKGIAFACVESRLAGTRTFFPGRRRADLTATLVRAQGGPQRSSHVRCLI